MKLYIIGSLRNPDIRVYAKALRENGYDVFDDWHAAGNEADDKWRDYEKERGRSFKEALAGTFARNAYDYDKRHLDAADAAILIYPAGKSGHLELGYMAGRGKPTYVFYPNGEPERWDMMYQFANGICLSLDDLLAELRSIRYTLV